jgi:hypothetical protein
MAGALRLEWDSRPTAVNDAEHRLSFEEPVAAFRDPLGRIAGVPTP